MSKAEEKKRGPRRGRESITENRAGKKQSVGPQIVHIHVPKTGGTASSRFLSQAFLLGEKNEELLSDELKHRTLRGWVSSSEVPRKPVFLTVWRAPHERAFSHFLWRLEHSSGYATYGKKVTLAGLWRSIRETPSFHSYIQAPEDSGGEYLLVIMDFSVLNSHLMMVADLLGGATTDLVHINMNPLKEKFQGRLRFWSFIARCLISLTHLRGDWRHNPKGAVFVIRPPLPRG